jgi:hypothetical protein
MRKTLQGGGNRNGRTRNDSREWEWALRRGENEKDNAGRENGNGRTRNDSLPLTVLISSRDFK